MKSTFSDPGPLLIGSVGGSGNSGVMGELKMLLHMHQVTHTHTQTHTNILTATGYLVCVSISLSLSHTPLDNKRKQL
jgi:hypothetical protein